MKSFAGISYLTTFVILILISERDGQTLQRPELCLEGPFTDAHEHLRLNWRLSGNAHYNEDFMHLTQKETNQKGAIWNTNPIIATDWEVQVTFRIHGKGVNLFGEGMAFWYAKEPFELGPVFGGKNPFSGLGVFIDTFEEPGTPHKHKHPYVSAMVNNGSVSYSHDEDGTNMQLGGCYAIVRNQPHVTRMAISYIDQILTIFLDVDGWGSWRECFSSPGVHLPTNYYFGVSASTGELFDSHEILSILTLDMNPTAPVNVAKSRIIPHAENFQKPKEYTPLVKETELPKPEELEPKVQKPAPISLEPESRTDEKEKETPIGETPEKSEPWSWTVKIAIALVFIVVLVHTVKACRKRSERKKEMMDKRMY